jgi:hypothetical protein
MERKKAQRQCVLFRGFCAHDAALDWHMQPSILAANFGRFGRHEATAKKGKSG